MLFELQLYSNYMGSLGKVQVTDAMVQYLTINKKIWDWNNAPAVFWKDYREMVDQMED